MSASRIGRLIGGRDHATVIHSCNQVEKRIKTDKDFASSVKTLEQIFDKKTREIIHIYISLYQ